MQTLTLLGMGMKTKDVSRITGFFWDVLYNLKKQALERGYNPTVIPVIYNMYVEDTYKSEKPSISLEKQIEIIAKVTTDQYGREKSIAEIAEEVEVLQSLVSCILKKYRFKKVTPI